MGVIFRRAGRGSLLAEWTEPRGNTIELQDLPFSASSGTGCISSALDLRTLSSPRAGAWRMTLLLNGVRQAPLYFTIDPRAVPYEYGVRTLYASSCASGQSGQCCDVIFRCAAGD
jgi:hypothetical protein